MLNKSIYRTLAVTNIKNNRRTYIPYLLTCVITVMMFYIIYALSLNKGLEHVPGGDNVSDDVGYGCRNRSNLFCDFSVLYEQLSD